MCGIAGWIDLKSDLSQQQVIMDKMSKSLAHRGPDASGMWLSQHAALAHRRLIVVDPAGGGQPMIRYKGGFAYILVYNGELYNTSDLRNELENLGHRFTSSSDTEVLLISYIQWGSECVEHLNGIFAFGIWDEKERSLFLARDRFGVKPLFYTQRGDSFIFASEIKALLVHPFVEPEVDAEGLAEIFALGPARTPGHGVFKGIHEVKPSYCITYDDAGIHQRRYWSLESFPHEDDENTTIEVIHTLVKDAIERQLVSDVPVCTFLSGGLDSSAITSIASMYFKKHNKGMLHTYSIDYVNNSKYFKPSSFQPNSDAPWIKRMVEECGTNHHYIEVDTPQLSYALIDSVRGKDLPGMADVDSSLWLFCREIKKEATVALSGECADEVFGGYPWFHKEEHLNANTFPWAKNLGERTRILSPDIYNLIKPEDYVARRYHETLEEVPRLQGEEPLEARRREMFYLNLTWFMNTLLDRKDRMSMAHGLEVRVPYCDHRLVQYVWNIPWSLKMYNGREKGILRQALKGLLPDDVLERKKSPYPKTHNPAYEAKMRSWLTDILDEGNSPLHDIIDEKKLRWILENEKSDYGKPWFGQLMALPQLFAYLIQVDVWMKGYKVKLV
ncbi:MAG: asparagine synthase (glutamine-hydrolyzing) [Bacillota bacterium]|nr:asparagine synthase (glutamine-hydrolyzing) [Bacillota bacterium]